MRIEISAGITGGASVAEYQLNMAGFISDVDDIISGFKAVTQKTENLPGGAGSLQGAVDELEHRIKQEEEKRAAAVNVREKTNDFLELAMRVDKQVARAVNRNRDEFYETNPWLKPAPEVDEGPWYEQAWGWICDKGEKVVEGVKAAWNWTKDTAKKAWNGLVEFYQEHWYEIVNWGVTALCIAGSIVAIALLVPTGGASLLVMAGITAGVSFVSGAIMAATRSITTQQRDNGTVDWGMVIKDATVAAVVGAVTGAIGAGLGGVFTSWLSGTGVGTLLHSSSAAVRMFAGAIIGGASEVASGVVVRGAAEATQSYIETGTVKFNDVWDAALDPKQMAWDAAIGGASGGFGAAKNPKPDVSAQPKYSSVHDDGIPKESLQAIEDYVGPNHYKEINRSYYDSSVQLSAQDQQIDFELTKVLNQSELPESFTTYHGGSTSELGDLKSIALQYKNDPAGLQQALEGQVFTKKGYMSTGTAGLAETYVKDFHVSIDVPAGAKGLDVSISPAGKTEYLFPANSQLEISSAEWRGGKLYVDASLVEKQPLTLADLLKGGTEDVVYPEARTWRQTEKVVSAFSGKTYTDQVSINSADLSVGRYGGKGTIRVDSLQAKIGDTVVDLTKIDSATGVTEFDVREAKNFKIETQTGRDNLRGDILRQATGRNAVLTQHGADVNQTYFIDTVGHRITIGDAADLYERLVSELPDNVDIFYMWK